MPDRITKENNNNNNSNNSEVETKDLSKVDINKFLKMNTVKCNVFIQLGSNKFIKLINANELYDLDLIKRYINKKIEYLFIPKNNFKSFMDEYSGNLSAILNSTDVNNDDNKITIQTEVLTSARNRARVFGIDDDVVNQATATTNSVFSMVQKQDNLSSLLKKMMQKKNYISEHSMLISVIATYIATNMNWIGESTIQKLSMAAMLHDVLLKSDELAMIDNINTPVFEGLSNHDKKAVLDHPYKISLLVDEIQNFLPDVAEIILTHHETPEGDGFPKKMSALRTTQLSCLFIITEDFVNHIYNLEKATAEEIEKIESYCKERYSKGNYRKPLEGLLKTTQRMKLGQ
ncbi:MAG: hypothetical protein HQK49_11755 [Oligoflexia bacterium]|nr:hypothetical protein [Oligoflexia bacterium]